MSSTDENSGCRKAAVLLGAISSLIAIIVFVTGKEYLPDFFKSEHIVTNSQSSQHSSPTSIPTSPPTNIPIPTSTFTPLVLPSATPRPNTPFGAVLAEGESWWQDGWELLLTSSLGYSEGGYTFAYGQGAPTVGIEIKLALTNHKHQDVVITYDLGRSISARSNLGEKLEVGYLDRSVFYVGGGRPWRNEFETITVVIPAGQTIELLNRSDSWGDPRIFIKANVADPYLTEIIISVSGIVNIADAQWVVRIPH